MKIFGYAVSAMTFPTLPNFEDWLQTSPISDIHLHSMQ